MVFSFSQSFPTSPPHFRYRLAEKSTISSMTCSQANSVTPPSWYVGPQYITSRANFASWDGALSATLCLRCGRTTATCRSWDRGFGVTYQVCSTGRCFPAYSRFLLPRCQRSALRTFRRSGGGPWSAGGPVGCCLADVCLSRISHTGLLSPYWRARCR